MTSYIRFSRRLRIGGLILLFVSFFLFYVIGIFMYSFSRSDYTARVNWLLLPALIADMMLFLKGLFFFLGCEEYRKYANFVMIILQVIFLPTFIFIAYFLNIVGYFFFILILFFIMMNIRDWVRNYWKRPEHAHGEERP